MDLRILLTCLLCLSVTLTAQAQEPPVQPAAATVPTADALQPLIEQARVDWGVPGLAVAVVHRGQVVLSAGFGVRELGRPELVDSGTAFAIASNTKAFTAAAIAMLQESGKLRWDDRVQQHLPWLQIGDALVTSELRIDDLLCHRSGLGTFSGDLLWWGTPYTPQQVLQRARHLPLKNRFRAEYGYSNLMFLAAGEVIREASGQSWQQFVAERILSPLQMQRTALSVRDLAALGNTARPHKTTLSGNQPIDWFNWDTMAAAGGVISCADDMAKWLQLQLRRGQLPNGERLFSEASSHRMWTPHTVIPVSRGSLARTPTTHFRSCGLGWMLADYRGRMTVGHGGGYDGMYSQVLLIPEAELGVVVLTNSMTGIASALTMTIADQYLADADGQPGQWLQQGLESDRSGRQEFYDRIQKAVQPVIAGTQPSHSLDAYAGKFECPLYGAAEVRLENGGLVLQLQPFPELTADLVHLHYDTWKIVWRKSFAWFAEGTVQFVPDAAGVFQELRLDVPNDDLWFDELKFRRKP